MISRALLLVVTAAVMMIRLPGAALAVTPRGTPAGVPRLATHGWTHQATPSPSSAGATGLASTASTSPATIPLAAAPTSVVCDGAHGATVTATVLDSAGYRVADGSVVTFSASGATSSPPTAPTSDGSAVSVITPAALSTGVISVFVSAGSASGSIELTCLTTKHTFVVTNTSDSGPGSLRQAIVDANADAAALSTIDFDILPAGGKIIVLASLLPQITSSVIIDGTTQPGYDGGPMIELTGSSNAYQGLDLTAGSSTVRGLIISGFSLDGLVLEQAGGNTIEDNFIGTDASGRVPVFNDVGVYIARSSGNLIVNNLISGNGANIEIDEGGDQNVVRGNFVGTDITGTVQIGGLFEVAGGNYELIGGITTGSGNLISGGSSFDGLYLDGSRGTLAQGNFIGVDASGTVAFPNWVGVFVLSSAETVLESNLVSGNATGIHIDSSGGAGEGVVVADNYIGTSIDGHSPLPNTGDGVNFMSVVVPTVSDELVVGNVIAHNGGYGVNVTSGSGDTIVGNSIFDNAMGGIALSPGANNDQPAPMTLTSGSDGTQTSVQGMLRTSATAGTPFEVDFFASGTCDGSGAGQGETYSGTTFTTTIAGGAAPINAVLAYPGTPGHVITATATDTLGNTSQFSVCVVLTSKLDSDGDGCGDGKEQLSGLDPLNPWDVYNVPAPALFAAQSPLTDFKDGAVSAADAQAVFGYFKAGAKTGTTQYEEDLNGNGIKDGVEYDRSYAGPGAAGSPDGVIAASDAQLAFAQFKKGYQC